MHTRVVCAVLSLFVVAHLGACSDDDGGQDPDSAVELDAGIDAEVVDAEVGDAGPVAPEDYRMEFLAVTQQMMPSAQWYSVAYFDNYSTAIEGRRCAVSHLAGCRVLNCRRNAVTVGPMDYVGVPAGDVTVTGGATDVELPHLQRNLFGNNGPELDASPIWNPGDTLTLSITGDVVPAFSEDETFPSAPQVITPTMDGTTVTVDRTTPFVVEWTPTTDLIRVSIEQSTRLSTMADWDGVAIMCDFPGGDGTGTIPTAVLAFLNPYPNPLIMTSFAVGHGHCTEITPGGYPVRLTIFNLIGPSAEDIVIE